MLTTNLLITWAQLLLESSQEALNIILQVSGYGRLYSPVEKFFQYLERLDERISVAMRHRQAGKLQGRSRDSHPEEGKRKNETYGKDHQLKTLRGAYEIKPEVGDRNNKTGCGDFCKTGQFHPRFLCPNIANGKVTEADLK